jgi:2'-hydroxyisoflavone reductase
MNRRQFLSATGGWLAAGALPARSTAGPPLHLLILGGTGFLGPHQVRAALARGHRVTLFNRGMTRPDAFPGVEELRGDRDGSLESLKGRRWHAVIDNSGYTPAQAGATARLLAGSVSQYLFVSTILVYRDLGRVGLSESSPVHAPAADGVRAVTDDSYAPLKVGGELAVRESFPRRHTILRASLVAGPGDHTDRFTYWPMRLRRGGEVLAPGAPGDPVQFIDVRDFAEWTIRCCEQRRYGTFNVTGPAQPLSFGGLLAACAREAGVPARLEWVPAQFLARHGVQPWSDLPVWVPPQDGFAGFHRLDNRLAVRHGLRFRPLAETVRDTVRWFQALSPARPLRAGPGERREREILSAWRRERATRGAP